MSAECLVCQEHRQEVPIPGAHLVSTEDVVAFHLPPWPPPAQDVYLGHLIVTSQRHAADFAELDDKESAAVGRWISLLSRSLKRLGAERVYVAAIGHGVPGHLHVHLVPRWPETPDDVAWNEVDEWDGARRGNFAAAASVADQVRATLSE